MINQFDLPLTQNAVGDAIGLNIVTASRTLKSMEDTSLIARAGTLITVMDVPMLEAMCDFRDR